MKQGVPQLIAWRMSGNSIHHKDFLYRLQATWLPSGETKPTQTMDPLLLNGLAGVTRGVHVVPASYLELHEEGEVEI